MTLDQQLDRVTKKINYAVEAVVAELVTDAFNKIKQNVEATSGDYGSPVYTGRYYSSHRISFGALDTSTSPEVVGGTQALPVYSELQDYNVDDFIANFTLGQTVYISNAVPYAIDIEEGTASPRKTPEGVYGVSLTSAEAYFISQGAAKVTYRVNQKFPAINVGRSA